MPKKRYETRGRRDRYRKHETFIHSFIHHHTPIPNVGKHAGPSAVSRVTGIYWWESIASLSKKNKKNIPQQTKSLEIAIRGRRRCRTGHTETTRTNHNYRAPPSSRVCIHRSQAHQKRNTASIPLSVFAHLTRTGRCQFEPVLCTSFHEAPGERLIAGGVGDSSGCLPCTHA